MNKKQIETARLKIIPCDKKILEAVLIGNEALSKLLSVEVPNGWTDNDRSPFEFAYQIIKAHHSEVGWWAYLPILKKENLLVGSGGYKGKPDVAGVIEIGYEIYEPYRNTGLATEFARALVDHGFENKKVKKILAHTLAHHNASCRVLEKCGMLFTDQIYHEEDGELWCWEVPFNKRETIQSLIYNQ